MSQTQAGAFPVDLVRADLRELVAVLDQNVISSVTLTREYIRRIHADNHAGRQLNAVLQLAPEALLLARAAELDASRDTDRRSLLHGIPILLKDSIATGPELGLRTTGGTPALVASRPTRNAPIVDRIVDAGMIVLGKANMSVLNGYFHPNLPLGWSPLGGQVLSAYGREHSVWGSSTGCAVAVSAGMCAAAIGVETNGSITSPSERAGVIGLKATHGLISNEGIIPNSQLTSAGRHDFDDAGPIGKSAYDMAALLDVLSSQSTTFMIDLQEDSLQLPRIGVARLKGIPDIDAEQIELFKQAVQCLDPAAEHTDIYIDGHIELDQDESVSLDLIYKVHQRDDWSRYLASCEGDIKTLADLVAWHADHPTVSFHPNHPGQDFLIEGLEGNSKKYQAATALAQAAARRAASALERTFVDMNIDAIMYPFDAAPSHLSSAGGFPVCSVPYSIRKSGRPQGVFFTSPKGQEKKLLKVIQFCENVFPAHPTPTGW